MLPTLREGDLLLVRQGVSPRPGDLVVARFPDGTLAVKRAVERRRTRSGAPGWWRSTSTGSETGSDRRVASSSGVA